MNPFDALTPYLYKFLFVGLPAAIVLYVWRYGRRHPKHPKTFWTE